MMTIQKHSREDSLFHRQQWIFHMSHSDIHRILREQTVHVDAETSVARAIESVREFTPADSGVSVYYVSVTENSELVGVVSLRELLNAEDDSSVSAIMSTDLVTVNTSDSLRTVIQRMTEQGFAVLPVVDSADHFVGVVYAHDVIDALDEQTTKRILKQAGLWIR